jgi:hypothetical protein
LLLGIGYNVAQIINSRVIIYADDISYSAHFYGEIRHRTESYRYSVSGPAAHISAVSNTIIAISLISVLHAYGIPAASAGHPCEIGLKTERYDVCHG